MHDTRETTHLVDIVARGAGEVPHLAEPVALDLHFEATLDDGVTSKLGERTLWKFVDLWAERAKRSVGRVRGGRCATYVGGNAVFLELRFLREVTSVNPR